METIYTTWTPMASQAAKTARFMAGKEPVSPGWTPA